MFKYTYIRMIGVKVSDVCRGSEDAFLSSGGLVQLFGTPYDATTQGLQYNMIH